MNVKILRSFVYMVATGLLYLGVPLLGWGLRDLAGYFSTAPRLGYAVVVGLFSLAVGVQAFGSIEGIRGKSGEQGKFVFRQRVVRVVLVLSLYLALLLIPYFDRHRIGVFQDGSGFRWVGVLLSVVGFTLVFWSGVALGRQYSADVTIQKEHRLITSSIYRFIRHPRYLGVISLTMGISLVFRSWMGMAASLFVIAMLIFRIRDEEVTMHTEFGADWEAYCTQSWRLIPYIF